MVFWWFQGAQMLLAHLSMFNIRSEICRWSHSNILDADLEIYGKMAFLKTVTFEILENIRAVYFCDTFGEQTL